MPAARPDGLSERELADLCGLAGECDVPPYNVLAHLKAAQWCVSQRQRPSTREEEYVSAAVHVMLGMQCVEEYRWMRRSSSGTSPRATTLWVESEQVESVLTGIIGLVGQDRNPGSIRMTVMQVMELVRTYRYADCREQDEWGPGMASGSGWRWRPTLLGRAVAWEAVGWPAEEPEATQAEPQPAEDGGAVEGEPKAKVEEVDPQGSAPNKAKRREAGDEGNASAENAQEPSGDEDDVLPEPITDSEWSVMQALVAFDPARLVKVEVLATPKKGQVCLSNKATRTAITRLIKLGLVERPMGEKGGARLTTIGRLRVRKITA